MSERGTLKRKDDERYGIEVGSGDVQSNNYVTEQGADTGDFCAVILLKQMHTKTE